MLGKLDHYSLLTTFQDHMPTVKALHLNETEHDLPELLPSAEDLVPPTRRVPFVRAEITQVIDRADLEALLKECRE